jgi:hypothetical protein
MKVFSLGLGVQSTAMYYLSSLGKLPRADFAIFADPGNEEPETYKYLQHLKIWQNQNNGIPIIIAKPQSILSKHIVKGLNSDSRFVSIPAYTISETGKKGMIRRQCTSEFKIKIIDKKIRELRGYKKYERNKPVEIWLGITTDEITRMKEPYKTEKYKVFVYPFLNEKIYFENKIIKYSSPNMLKWNRQQCAGYITQLGQPLPIKSACTFCPYKSDAAWNDIKQNKPKLWNWLIEFDKKIRNGSKKGFVQPLFLHRSCKPLEDVELLPDLNKSEFNCSALCHT